jgi:hypothetical protein
MCILQRICIYFVGLEAYVFCRMYYYGTNDVLRLRYHTVYKCMRCHARFLVQLWLVVC